MKTIFYDVDTQNDFMNKDYALYVPDAELIKPNLAQLTKYACEKGTPIFGSVDRHFGTEEYKHREGELQRNGGPFPNHCMDGTDGQLKIKETRYLCEDFTEHILQACFVENSFQKTFFKLHHGFFESVLLTDATLKTSILDLIEKYTKKEFGRAEIYTTPGIFFEKQHYDVATNPWFEKVMQAVAPQKAIVYGVATDYCVKAGAIALRKVGIQEVYVVTDTIKGITQEGSQKALEEMANEGIKFSTIKEIIKS